MKPAVTNTIDKASPSVIRTGPAGDFLPPGQTDSISDRLSMAEARTRLANELHDSLAQTLASLRIQVRVLDETLHQGDECVTWEELEKMENVIEEANHELRQLIARFRAPLEDSEVVDSINTIIQKFREETDVPVFLQNEWTKDNLPASMRKDFVGIVQEALANIRKHAQANTVRVMLRHQNGYFQLLVEDDGVGFPVTQRQDGSEGEHIGLSIMQERADRLNGELRLESEPNEGTNVTLRFEYSVS